MKTLTSLPIKKMRPGFMNTNNFDQGNVPRVNLTIGLCVKNCAKTVSVAIESLKSQTYPHFLTEVIVVDGQSSDQTLAVAEERLSESDFHVRYFSDSGRGLGTARQIVAENALGKYIVWLDGDILLPPDYLSSQVSFMEEHPKVGATRGTEGFSTYFSRLSLLEFLSKLRYYKTLEKSSLSTFAATFRTSAIREVGGFDKKITGAQEDIDSTIRMRMIGWQLVINSAKFYPEYRHTWKALFDQCIWYGIGESYISKKYGGLKNSWSRLPPFGFFAGLSEFQYAQKLGGLKAGLILPFYRSVKDMFWWIGFIKGSFSSCS